MKGSYQFEKLESRHAEATLLAERALMRMEGFLPLLERHGLPSSGSVLDLGCGHGIRAEKIAAQFPSLRVVGLDRSAELLEQARVHERENLRFELGDLYSLPFADESFDFVYARLVFMHLSDPRQALREIFRCLKPGGRVLIEDADRDCMFFEPSPPLFPAFWEKVQQGQRRLGGDPNVGRRLAPYLKEFGFADVRVESQPILGGGGDIAFLVRTLMPSLNVYLEPEDRAGGEAAIAQLGELAQDPRATFYHFWFVVSGRKS